MSDELTIIEKSSVITTEDINKLAEITEELKLGFENRIIFRPRYLQEVSVLDDVKHPTADAKYWQSNLERDIQFQNLVSLSFDFRELYADMEIKSAILNTLDLTIPLQKAKSNKIEIQIERMVTELNIMQKTAADRVREIVNWTEIMNELEDKLEFSKDDPEEHMAKSYPLRFARQVELLKKVGTSDMNGAMNILGLFTTAFNNPKTQELERVERDK